MFFEESISRYSLINFKQSLRSLINFDLSSPVNLLSLISRIDLAWLSVKLKFPSSRKFLLSVLINSLIKSSEGIIHLFFINFSFASFVSFEDLIISITLSIFSKATDNPSKICAFSLVFLK